MAGHLLSPNLWQHLALSSLTSFPRLCPAWTVWPWFFSSYWFQTYPKEQLRDREK